METIPFLLAKPDVHCMEVYLYNPKCFLNRNHVLGSWIKKVSKQWINHQASLLVSVSSEFCDWKQRKKSRFACCCGWIVHQSDIFWSILCSIDSVCCIGWTNSILQGECSWNVLSFTICFGTGTQPQLAGFCITFSINRYFCRLQLRSHTHWFSPWYMFLQFMQWSTLNGKLANSSGTYSTTTSHGYTSHSAGWWRLLWLPI